MYYSDDIIEEVRSRNNIVDVVGSYVSLSKKGTNYWGLCPFHNEKTPSFSVNGNKQIFKCFGCGEGGNVISFVMKYENLTFQEAVKALADRAGLALPEAEATPEQKAKAGRRSQLLEVNKEAATYFYRMLRTPHGEKGMRYLRERGLSEETMQKFGLGFAGVNGRDVVSYLRSKGFNDELIRDSGIATLSEGNGLVCPFWNRVMYPIMDANHRVIGFGGRVMGDFKPKYLNSPETDIFDKRRNLYGFVFARTNRTGNFILCEGYMDVIAMHQAGFSQAVASLGTAFTEEQAMLLSRYTKKVYLAYDSDGAGVKAATRAIGILKKVGISGRVINMRPCKDPDEFIKTNGREAFQERIDQAENSFYFLVRIRAEQFDQSDPESRTEFHKEIAGMLAEEFKVEVERENYLVAICQKYSIPEGSMRKLVNQYAASEAGIVLKEKPKETLHKKNNAGDSGKRAQAMLLTWLTDEPELLPKISKYISVSDFTEELYRKVAERVYADIAGGKLNPAAVIDMFEDEEAREVAGLFSERLPDTETEEERNRAFSDIIIKVKKNSYDYYCSHMAGTMEALMESVNRKKELENLQRTLISLK